ncbi:sensor histidine kinase [Pedobacter arcticus]|uniref:sensor histidine kinase n=1 Tax=Pedobacter arcticus TaxID=752140 RepID=UPI0002EA726C|nr:ATP-binding protein [Pedobacter arcticus]
MLPKDLQIERLAAHNNELENYFRNTIIPQLFIDGDLILRKFTPPAMKQFSLKLTDIGKSISDIKDNFRFPTIVENIQQVIDDKEILEKEIQTTDFRWFQMDIIPYIEQKTKKANGVIMTFVEITIRIKDLKDQEKLILDHELLLDTISHDIKSPLTSLMLTISLLKKNSIETSEQYKSLFYILENSVKKMQSVINELTDAGKQKQKYKTQEELLSFENILEDVRLTLSSNIQDSGAKITSEVNVSEILYSRRKLRSIVYNLVNNAIKFKSTERKPEIFINTTREKNYVVISVKDNGIGIEKANRDAIFKKYNRVETDIEGSGIGLYLVKEIVSSSKGKIILKSKVGQGSEFKVFLKQ